MENEMCEFWKDRDRSEEEAFSPDAETVEQAAPCGNCDFCHMLSQQVRDRNARGDLMAPDLSDEPDDGPPLL